MEELGAKGQEFHANFQLLLYIDFFPPEQTTEDPQEEKMTWSDHTQIFEVCILS